jgi:uncharacterized protein (DUF58 family)
MLTPEIMRQVRLLELRTRRSVTETFAGEYRSAFRGRGMEFDEVREYQPGDDVRSIDWNVTARAGKPYIKRFVEERELTVMLAVDLSGSGAFGSIGRSKNELAAELCCVLAFAATGASDKVGAMIFTEDVELFIPPAKGRRHALRITRDVLAHEPKKRGTNIAGACEHLARALKKRAVVFLISDFLDDGYETPLSLLRRQHDVVAIRAEDPLEHDLPPVGLIEFEDAETGRVVTVDTLSKNARKKYAEAARRRRSRATADLRRLGLDQCAVQTGEPYIHALVELFRRRERRR